jgi:hypothetical protein
MEKENIRNKRKYYLRILDHDNFALIIRHLKGKEEK